MHPISFQILDVLRSEGFTDSQAEEISKAVERAIDYEEQLRELLEYRPFFSKLAAADREYMKLGMAQAAVLGIPRNVLAVMQLAGNISRAGRPKNWPEMAFARDVMDILEDGSYQEARQKTLIVLELLIEADPENTLRRATHADFDNHKAMTLRDLLSEFVRLQDHDRGDP